MKCLTVCQPFAHLIVSGDKAVENRTWPTSHRGPLLIHAGLSRSWWTQELERDLGIRRDDPRVDYGFIVGRCRVVACVRVDEARRRGLKYAGGPWCWILEDRVSFAVRTPYRGAMGLFEVEEALLLGIKTIPARLPGCRIDPFASAPVPAEQGLFGGSS